MNMNTKTLMKEFNVAVRTNTTSIFSVKAMDMEDARQLVSAAFGFADGSHKDAELNRMHIPRTMIGALTPENALEEMECILMHSISIDGADDDCNRDKQTSVVTIREGDFYASHPAPTFCENFVDKCDDCDPCGDCEYSDVCEELPDCVACESCRENEALCLLYLLGQPAELIPMSAVKECAAALGNQLVHECIPDTALFITYNPCSVLDVEDARYLIAPALVYGLVDNEPVPMTEEECATIQKLLADRTVTLTADGEEFHALKLFD